MKTTQGRQEKWSLFIGRWSLCTGSFSKKKFNEKPFSRETKNMVFVDQVVAKAGLTV